MCRIAGFFGTQVTESNSAIVNNMVSALKHGGPDFQQVRTYPPQVVLGHARLSILDLSDAANQPYEWSDYVICYNGEVYNFKDIREDLQKIGYTFQTTSDTEVIIKSYDAWGIDAVKRYVGMFAFALWDKKKNKFLLVRDRLGVKPLFYIKHDKGIYFFSELKAIHQVPNLNMTINNQAIIEFLQKGYIPGKYCIYNEVKKAEPGTILQFDNDLSQQSHRYWNVAEVGTELFHGNYEDAKQSVRETLVKSIENRLVSDVPVGVLLSGGIDSSIVTAIASKELKKPLKTFTIAFDDKAFNESHIAKKISNTFHTDHLEFNCSSEILLELIDELPFVYDEPFGDASALPTLYLSKMTSSHVKVALGGDGGDEIFGGYVKYKFTSQFRNHKNTYKFAAGLLRSLGTEKALRIANLILRNRYRNTDTKVRKFLHASLSDNWMDFFDKSSFLINDDLLRQLLTYDVQRTNPFKKNDQVLPKSFIRALGVIDMESYLTDDLLVKVDRASMRYGLEAREPLLDHHLIELGLSLRDEWKIKNGTTKFILRDILADYLPKEITQAPKSGFSVPVIAWLQKELRPYVFSMVDDASFLQKFHLDKKIMQRIIDQFYIDKPITDSLLIWNLLMLHKWYQKWLT